MFIQVIKGKTSNSESLLAQLDKWRAELKPGATGFLGSTCGVADDGTFILLARFQDADSANANSQRPEQGEWWSETAPLFDGEPSFRESSDISTMLAGGSNDAGFVQIMEGSESDRDKAMSLETPELLEQLRVARPDLLGAVRMWFDATTYLEAAYFTSEEDARKGETSNEFTAPQEDFAAVFGEISFTDLRNPMFD